MTNNTNNDPKISTKPHQPGLPLPQEVLEQVGQDITKAGGEWTEPPEYKGAIGRTMFDLPSSEDNTVTVLLSKDDIHAAPSQALVRIHSIEESCHISLLILTKYYHLLHSACS